MKTIYLDSHIISDLLKSELSIEDQNALETILLSIHSKKLKLIVLSDVKEKINRIPELYLTQNINLLKLLKSIQSVNEVKYCTNLFNPASFSSNSFDSLYEKLIKIMDNVDARQIYQAIKNHSNKFLTNNLRLNKSKKDIISYGLEIINPIELEKELIQNANS